MPHPRTSRRFIDSKIRKALPRLYSWYRKNHRPLPWRLRPNPYRIAVSEFMAQQTRLATVIPYYRRWIRRFPTWSALARAREREVLRLWEGLGYYRRARFLHCLARTVVRLPRRQLPSSPLLLRTLPGIGDYTAGAIASMAFGVPAPAFDGNVARVLGRLTSRRGRVADLSTLRHLASLWVPKKDPGTHNQALMELGALVCLPKSPNCPSCPLQRSCPSKEQIPSTSRHKPAPTAQKESILVIRRGSSVWLTQEHPQDRWRGLWLLPTQHHKKRSSPPLHRLRYPYTRYLITAEVHLGSSPPSNTRGRWFNPDQLRQATLPAPHRRILRLLEIG